MKKTIFSASLLLSAIAYSQTGNVGINTTDPKTTLEIAGAPTDITKADGLTAPKITRQNLTYKTSYGADQNGAIIFVTTLDGTASGQTIDVTAIGYYYFDGAANKWKAFSAGSSTATAGWALTGNAGTTAGTNFLGTTDDQDLVFKRNNAQAGLLNNANQNTSFGVSSLPTTTTGAGNVAIGYSSLNSNTTGAGNVAIGNEALKDNTTQSYSTAIGGKALSKNAATANTAIGYGSLTLNYSGINNTSIGYLALTTNSIGSTNVAVGAFALQNNTDGGNTAVGMSALSANIGGYGNSALGKSSLVANTSGYNNSAIGYLSGGNLTTGINNIAVGANTNLPTATGSNQMNIGNTIFGTGMAGTLAAPAGNIGINTATPGASLEVNGITANTSGLKFTKLTSATASTAGAATLGVDASGNVVVAPAAVAAATGWALTGNAGTTAGTNFVGTTDDKDLVFKRNNVQAGWLNSADYNTSFGVNGLPITTTGRFNSALGYNSLKSNTAGTSNIATGYTSLFNNTTGSFNTMVGESAGFANTSGNGNTGIGSKALAKATIGSNNIAIGNSALGGGSVDPIGITTGSNNIGIGYNAQVPSRTANNQMNIGHTIFGIEMTGSTDNFTGTISPAGKIGINTTAPGAALEVNSQTAGASGLKFTQLNSSSTAAAGAATLGVDASGNVVVAQAVALNITTQTGNYTATATDDIILFEPTANNFTITLPTTGVQIGKKYYINNKTSFGGFISPLPTRDLGAPQYIPAQQSLVFMYVGGTGNGAYINLTSY